MDWLHETYRKLYVRVDAKWGRHPLSTRSLASEILKYADDDGCIYLAPGESPSEAIFRTTQAHKYERKRIADDVRNLIEDLPDDLAFLTWEKSLGRLRIRNFVAAQGVVDTAEQRSRQNAEASQTASAIRQRRRRERRLSAVCDAHGNFCFWCGQSDVPLNIDHLTPVNRGGTEDLDNLKPCCKPCNSRKSNMTADEYDDWLERLLARANERDVTRDVMRDKRDVMRDVMRDNERDVTSPTSVTLRVLSPRDTSRGGAGAGAHARDAGGRVPASRSFPSVAFSSPEREISKTGEEQSVSASHNARARAE